MAKLTTMVHTKKTKIGAEVLIYYNLDSGKKIGTLVKTAAGVEAIQESSCAEDLNLPTSGFAAYGIRVSNQSIITPADGVSAAAFPAKSPIGVAIENDTTYSATIGDYDFSGGSVGDQIEVIALPNPDNDVLICYDQGFSATPGNALRAIPRKMNPADHYVRQRPENTISLGNLFVSSWDGLQRIIGVPVTIIAKVFPEGGSVPSEIQYFTNVRVFPPSIDVPSESNDSIELTGEGNFNDVMKFAAQPS